MSVHMFGKSGNRAYIYPSAVLENIFHVSCAWLDSLHIACCNSASLRETENSAFVWLSHIP